MGLSTLQQERIIPDIARDVEQLADTLGVGKFSVLGVSAGAPYALACGVRLPGRVTRIGLVSPAGPFADRRYRSVLGSKLKIVRSLSGLAPSFFRRLLHRISKVMMADPERFLLRLAAHAGSPDREVILANSAFFSANLREAFREGEAGPVRDAELLFLRWGFQASETPQTVFLWHGGRDRTIPQGVGIRLSEEIPNCHSFFPPEEGHFSLPVGWMREIISTLVVGTC
jgi:pimeloyl-ACP methyl ester carboxylesterase